MDTLPVITKYKNHRFPDIEELLAERGVLVTYESIRKWCRKFGQQYAN